VVRKAFAKNRDILVAQVTQAKQEASGRVQVRDAQGFA